MSKKRRTRKEKIIAQLRREISKTDNTATPIPDNTSISLPAVKFPTQSTPQDHFRQIKDYGYVLSDAKKTFGIVMIIFLANISIFLALEKHIIRFSFLGI